MKKVIAVIDIGKTNKKLFLFDKNFDIVHRVSKQFDEVKDDDDCPCDDIEAIETWIKEQISQIQLMQQYVIKAINFSTHGATVIYLDKNGKRVTPVYNYLKPLSLKDFDFLYEQNEGIEEFSRKTASPSYGMLNAGIQMLWIKYQKPHFWEKAEHILHYPQYLSYIFTKKITADYTSIGAHTAIWDFDNMQYHTWLKKENISLPSPTNGKEAIIAEVNGQSIAIGSGLHDSSSSIIPLLERKDNEKFILLSTGTWIIAMNPFSKEVLTQHQLKSNCLCFMTPEKKQIKSSMQFLGKIHEVYLKAFNDYFNEPQDIYLKLKLSNVLAKKLIQDNNKIFLQEGIDTVFEANSQLLSNFNTYEEAYYQLIYEISVKVITGINLILDKNSTTTTIYVSGGFIKNEVFISFLKALKPSFNIKISNAKDESALGAALLMKKYF